MLQHNQNQDSPLANFAGIVLALTFVTIFALISTNSKGTPFSPSVPPSENGQVVAQAVPTDTVQPTAMLLPTFTTEPLPTSTPVATTAPADFPTATRTVQSAVDTNPVGSADAPEAGYDPALVAQGETLFAQCVACHGPDARGLPNLGKNLVESEFVAAQTDDELVQFIITGRPIWDPLNTTGIDMPGKGGNPAMTTEDIQAIVAYLRTLSAQSSGQTEAVTVSDEPTAHDPAVVSQGAQLFAQCAACHGPDARGLPNLGKDLVTSEFVAGLTDEELLEFIKTGRPIWDPLNTTGIDMPGKGGNPALTDDDIRAIIAYIRSLPANSGG